MARGRCWAHLPVVKVGEAAQDLVAVVAEHARLVAEGLPGLDQVDQAYAVRHLRAGSGGRQSVGASCTARLDCSVRRRTRFAGSLFFSLCFFPRSHAAGSQNNDAAGAKDGLAGAAKRCGCAEERGVARQKSAAVQRNGA